MLAHSRGRTDGPYLHRTPNQPVQDLSLLCPQLVSLNKARTHTRSPSHARAQNFSHNLSGHRGPTHPCRRPVLARLSVLTLALTDSHRGLRLHDLLSLPLALPGSGAAHRRPQAQDGQQQQPPGSRTPEHLEWMGGESPSPGGKRPRNCGSPRRLWEKSRGGDAGRKMEGGPERIRSCGRRPGSHPGLLFSPLSSAAGASG